MKLVKILFLFNLATSVACAAELDEKALTNALDQAASKYDDLKGYSTLFYKTEWENGVAGEEEKIYLKFEKPFKIFMGWLNTHKKGLQVVYERGQHGGKLAIHEPGLLFGLVPVVFLPQDSPWVKQGSASYNIEDAGLGTFLTDFKKSVQRGVEESKLKIHQAQHTEKHGLSGEMFEVTFENTQKNSDYFAYRIEVLFDETTKLPVYQKLFDWEDKPIGIYVYKDFKAGTELDESFKKQIDRQLLRIYINKNQDKPDSKQPKNNFSSKN